MPGREISRRKIRELTLVLERASWLTLQALELQAKAFVSPDDSQALSSERRNDLPPESVPKSVELSIDKAELAQNVLHGKGDFVEKFRIMLN